MTELIPLMIVTIVLAVIASVMTYKQFSDKEK
jgi:Tfp pilus assembly protein PilE